MNILIYGGCHAEVIRKTLERYSIGEHHFTKIINFRLIASGKPFPYNELNDKDIVVFNPIFNKDSYNTEHLERYCISNNIKMIKYPWLQWGGYWPQVAKRNWGSIKEWGIPILHTDSQNYKTDEDFYESVFYQSTVSQSAESWVQTTTKFLQKNEEMGKVDIKVSQWILDNYRQKRLFQTPDHPSTVTYKYVIDKIAKFAGIELDRGFHHISTELQPGVLTPILPNVNEKLSLGFCGGEWSHNEIWGNSKFTLKEFVLSHSHLNSLIMARSVHNTVFKSDEGERINVKRGSKHLMSREKSAIFKNHSACEVRLQNNEINLVHLFNPHWRFSTSEYPQKLKKA